MIKAFVRASVVGSLAASWLPLIVGIGFSVASLPQGLNGDGALLPILWFSVTPFLLALVIVVPALLLIGLPVTWILHRFDVEDRATYVGIGTICGFAIPLIYCIAWDFWPAAWISLLGAFSGAMTAQSWWNSRRRATAVGFL